MKYQNQYLGKWMQTGYRSLWTSQMMKRAHELEFIPEQFEKIVVGVDPAATNTKNSDATGLIVVGYDSGMYYVLDEATGNYSPLEWAQKVKELYVKWQADYVVAEVNMGGDLVESNIRNVCGSFIQIEKVHASKGKILRA
ncbi:MAG: hypothetical protein J6Q61_00640 [Bacteroidales bacterium]|nr:hypothetical protein [Bacteroidales bacterium]